MCVQIILPTLAVPNLHRENISFIKATNAYSGTQTDTAFVNKIPDASITV